MDDAALAESILSGTDDGVIVADPEGVIRLWNAAAEQMFGWSADEAVGRDLDLIIPEKLRDRHNEGYRQVMRTGVTSYAGRLLSVPALHRDGGRLSLEFSITLLKDEDGRVEAVAAIMREVTERRETEKALRAELAELRRRLGE